MKNKIKPIDIDDYSELLSLSIEEELDILGEFEEYAKRLKFEEDA